MKPIISPWLFYLAGVGTNVSIMLCIFGFVGAMGGAAYVIAKADDEKVHLRVFIGPVILLLLAMLIPEEDTVYKMMAASVVTEDNVKATVNTGKEVVDYIVDAVDRIMDEKEE